MKVSLVVDDTEAKHCVQALHSVFFEKGFVSVNHGVDRELNGSPVQIPVNSPPAPASSGDKRKADGDHLEASLSARKPHRTDIDHCSVVEETERTAFSDVTGNPAELFKDDGGVPEFPERQPKEQQQEVLPVPVLAESSSAPEAVQPEQQVRVEVGESSSGPPGVLKDKAEGIHPPMTDDGALEDIRRRILAMSTTVSIGGTRAFINLGMKPIQGSSPTTIRRASEGTLMRP
ncbi:uncharacterized protein LOC119306786 [Triticum dicoccoides]|uniref:uncharacterized protein LOC119306786 n=1 Tax=Triticum dicoccoides TaxID=85692 RepID=UPI000E795FC1|nr:uncharacterized protein LOC119306786 [Triticum dicoccoides]